MKIWTAAAATLAALILSTQASAATVVTFDEFTQAGTGLRDLTASGTLESGGFVFQSVQVNNGFKSWRMNDAQNADPDGATLVHNWANTFMTVSRSDGSIFDLVSLDLADLSNAGGRVSNLFEFNFADGSKEAFNFGTDTAKGLETLMLNRKGLKSFALKSTNSGWTQLDNLTWSEHVAAVPEPGAWAMMILGFATIGSALRRRRNPSLAPLSAA